MTEDNCVPVQVALQLMDSSSLGRAHQTDQFQETHKQLQKALRSIVNGRSSPDHNSKISANISLEYHQGFNSSMATFHNIQSSIHNSQHRVRALREGLALAKSNLSTTKPELKGLAASSQEYEDMLQILNQMWALSRYRSSLLHTLLIIGLVSNYSLYQKTWKPEYQRRNF